MTGLALASDDSSQFLGEARLGVHVDLDVIVDPTLDVNGDVDVDSTVDVAPSRSDFSRGLGLLVEVEVNDGVELYVAVKVNDVRRRQRQNVNVHVAVEKL